MTKGNSTRRHNRANKAARAKKAEEWKNTRGGDPRTSWLPKDLDNERFAAFYQAQKIVEQDEWNSFLEHLRAPLPACFRINTGYAFHEVLKQELQDFVGEKIILDDGTTELEAVQNLKWVKEGNAYKLGADKRTIRKSQKLKDLHTWMVKNTDNGNITRQEAVSMVPPLALDVKPHHVVLDMCAAPGSKTTQMMEIIQRSLADDESRQGLIVANDADTDRAYMLVHQTRRVTSPLLLITTHKGQMWPKIRVPSVGDEPEYNPRDGYFDRVLADVPCSGDGTMRKNPMIWDKWSTSSGLALHPLQLTIARRGYQVLKPGGLMVYSTCSMSPYEDEAAVAQLLRETRGTNNELELVDAREFLPAFTARQGINSWYVLDDIAAFRAAEKKKREDRAKLKKELDAKDAENKKEEEGEKGAEQEPNVGSAGAGSGDVDGVGEEQEDIGLKSEAPGEAKGDNAEANVQVDDPVLQKCIDMGMKYYNDAESVPENMRSKIRSSLFPPTQEEIAWMHLEKCLRCVPQDEDTGGFFVATLRKKVQVENSGDKAPAGHVETEPEVVAVAVAEAEAEAEAENGESEGPAAKKRCVGDEGETEVTQTAVTAAPKINQVDFAAWDEALFDKMKAFYGLLPPISRDSFFIRQDFMAKKHGKNKRRGGKGPDSEEGGQTRTIYYIPRTSRALMESCEMKIVSAGIKAFERHPSKSSEVEYRLTQDAVNIVAPHMTKRKVTATAQDFCNLLGGGLVSFATLSDGLVTDLNKLSTGTFVCTYTYRDEDVVAGQGAVNGNPGEKQRQQAFHLVCFKGSTRAVNVMCHKLDIEKYRHQLSSLGVYREKIKASSATEDTTGKAEPVEQTTTEPEK